VKALDKLDLETHRTYDIVYYSTVLGGRLDDLFAAQEFCHSHSIPFVFSATVGTYSIAYNQGHATLSNPGSPLALKDLMEAPNS
jgi:hypothetical protein